MYLPGDWVHSFTSSVSDYTSGGMQVNADGPHFDESGRNVPFHQQPIPPLSCLEPGQDIF